MRASRLLRGLLRSLLRLLLVLLAVVGGLVALTWAPDRPVAALAPRWAPAPSRFVEVDGLSVHLRDEGASDDPEPIVLLHGTSASLHTWDGWVDALKGHRRVIRLDLPGFGLTGPTPEDDYTMARYVRFMTALLDTLRLGRVVLVGNSFGGWVSWETALAAPDRVSRLILVDSGGYPPRTVSVPIGFKIAQISWLRPLAENILPRRMISSSLENVYGDPGKVTPALIDRYYELTLRQGNRRAVAERFRQARSGEHAERIRLITQPTLILWGARDRLIPPELGERFHQDIAGSKLVQLPGLGHIPHEEDPQATVGAARAFLGVP